MLAARRSFGALRIAMQSAVHTAWMSLRTLFRSPAFAALATVVAALGSAGCILALTTASVTLLHPLPYPEPDRLIGFLENSGTCGRCDDTFSYATYRSLEQSTRAIFRALGAYEEVGFDVRSSAGQSIPVSGAVVTGSFFQALGGSPASGRLLLPSDDRSGGQNAAVLSTRGAERIFANQTAIVGRQLVIDGRIYTIVGVLPSSIALPANAEIWISRASSVDNTLPDSAPVLQGLGRLRNGILLTQAAASLTLARRQVALAGDGGTPTVRMSIAPLARMVGGQATRGAWTIIATTALVYLIVCVNLASILLMRTLARTREIATRVALGASRFAILSYLVTESFIIAVAGWICGIAIVYAGRPLVASLLAKALDRIVDLPLAWQTLSSALAVALFTAAVVMIPVVRGVQRLDLQSSLREGAQTATLTRSQSRVRQYLVIGEMACALILLGGAGVLGKSYEHLRQVPLGYDADTLLVARVSVRAAQPTDRAHVGTFMASLDNHVGSLPHIEASGVWAVSYPQRDRNLPALALEGSVERISPRLSPQYAYNVSPGVLRLFGLRIVQGRDFDPADNAGSTTAALVNEEAARRWWPGESALGKRIKVGPVDSTTPWLTVVGVVNNTVPIVKHGIIWAISDHPSIPPQIYLPMRQLGQSPGDLPLEIYAGLRSRANVNALAKPLAGILAQDVPDAVLDQPVIMRDLIVGENFAFRLLQFNMRLLAVCAGLALGLVLLGVYAIVGESARRRTREIGVRMALGARPRDVLMLILREGVSLGACGILLGMAASYGLNGIIGTLYYAVTPNYQHGLLWGTHVGDARVYAAVCTLMLLVVVIAALIPALQATSVDPLTTLRSD